MSEYFVKQVVDAKSNKVIKTVYAADLRVASFNPSAYGEVDPTIYSVEDIADNTLTLVPKTDEEILTSAKLEAIDELHAKRSFKLDTLINAKGMSAGVLGAYKNNEEAAKQIASGHGDDVMCSYSTYITTYKDYLTPKAVALGFSKVEDFAEYILYEVYWGNILGGNIEEEYYKLKTAVEQVKIANSLEEALAQIHSIVDSWVMK